VLGDKYLAHPAASRARDDLEVADLLPDHADAL
jgi:hypothetical protein